MLNDKILCLIVEILKFLIIKDSRTNLVLKNYLKKIFF